MAEFHFTNWFHGLHKRVKKVLEQGVDPKSVEIQVQHSFYMNLMYNAVPNGPLKLINDIKEPPVLGLEGCKIIPCLQSSDPYYKILVDNLTVYERTEL